MTSKHEELQRLVSVVSSSDTLCNLIRNATLPADADACSVRLNEELKKLGFRSRSDVLSDISSYCGTNPVSHNLTAALAHWKKVREDRKTLHREIVDALFLKSNKRDREKFLAGLTVIPATVLPQSYPPRGLWVCEDEEILHTWKNHIGRAKQADKRKKRKKMMIVDPHKLQHDILPNQSCIIRVGGCDVGMVIREFCEDNRVLSWADGVVVENVGKRKSVRLEDPGKICLVGYTNGALSDPKFDWAKNLLHKTSQKDQDDLNYRTSSAFALFWNMVATRVPEHIYKDITDFFIREGICRMDSNQKSEEQFGEYTIEIDGTSVSFRNVELAPPQGIVSANYSRPIHFEPQPHKFSFAWTTRRTLGTEISDGGHFYFSKYGIRVRSAPNTLVVWMPEEDHGTGLPNISPSEALNGFYQAGMSIVTPKKICLTWRKYVANMMDASCLADEECYPKEHYSRKDKRNADPAAGSSSESSSSEDEGSDLVEDSDDR